MILHFTTRIWTISKNRTEYENFSNMLQGKQKNAMNYDQINQSLLEESKKTLQLKEEIYVIHDGCDLRKSCSDSMEHLTKVKSLTNQWVTGYKSFNSVCISDIDQKIHLLSCSPYSYSEPHYQNALGVSYNESDIMNYQVQHIDKELKDAYPQGVLWHIFDSRHDDVNCFETIDSMESLFCIRLKMSRNSNQSIEQEGSDKQYIKLKDQIFNHCFTRDFDKFFYKNVLHTQCKAHFSYDTYVLKDKTYWVVKIIITDRGGKNIFKQPMILITNLTLSNDELAYKVFQVYLKRSKIEGVFKFLKEQLGWEEFQIRNFTAIQNIISLAFYVGAYFFEIESQITKNYQFRTICLLAKCKNKFTKHFFLQGLIILAHVALFQQYVKEQHLTQTEIDELLELAPKIE